MKKKIIPTKSAKSELVNDQESRKLAEDELIGFDSGKLEEANINAHNRRENFRDEISKAAKYLFWLACAGISTLFFTEIWHLVTPDNLHYITLEQKAKIETILFSGSLAAIVSKLGEKYI